MPDATAPGPTGTTLLVRADVSATSVATVVVEVTAPDLASPLAFNIPIVNGVATGTITVTAGSNRTITMRAYDAAGVETHRGSITTTIRSGVNPAISLVLTPLTGDAPIDVTLGSVTITVTPLADTLVAGDTVSLTARVLDADGAPVLEPVSWATLDPRIATVERTSDSTGRVTAREAGTITIVATFAGVGAAATIVVSPDPGVEVVVTGVPGALYVTAPPEDPSRLFVVRQIGIIRVVQNGTLLSAPFLDISGLIRSGGEEGLLSMAFHPSYAQNGFFYVHFTDPNGDVRIVRYRVSSDPNVADPASGDTILAIPHQPNANHNGGLVMFGPDAMLYLGLGDGDVAGQAQDSTTLLGKILRVDVDGGTPYAIPPDNPFAGHPTAREEIWAYGLRNPWRFSFDRATNELYIADVGEFTREEVNVRSHSLGGGENYGWDIMEGTACFNPPSGCNQAGLVLPVYEYDTHVAGTCSITGGYVYRGTAVPILVGRYFFADWCAGWVKSFRYAGGVVADVRDHTADFGNLGNITSFGEDARGELYIVTQSQNGTVYRIIPKP
ncbi:MAG TPA: PQQ-dependent sugar dehydrogenase [Gemmatimonadales bacterium]|nr:PQQ-dependent sugar dehydrogenase [Gemmatimonadales bacterium]